MPYKEKRRQSQDNILISITSFESTLDCKQSNVDSGADRSRIIKENDILTGFSVEEGETTVAAVEGISFPLEREEAVEG